QLLGSSAGADAGEAAARQGARLAAPECGQIRLGRGDARGDRLGMGEEELPGLRERDGLRAAWPLDELLPDEALERGDLLADGALGVAERDRRLRERPLP